jgi:hypothetical protein
MSRDIDLAELVELDSFNPSDSQIALKLLLHERAPSSVLGKVTECQIELLTPYIAPFKYVQIASWIEHPGFFLWLLTPDSHLMTIQKAKQKAANVVTEILDLDYASGVDSKLAMVKLKAAELLLRTDMRKEQKVNQTINFKNSPQIPKHLANKSTEALEAELKRLQG